ncbi:MAG: nucleoside phosphorylase [Anaeromicrobium sp.]|jgi:uridine phosphorylase|uniref:nucleoside phosphorylase n=1 Tax=Anaeromicrobium sp. TaxID=1929132 RepID=UPI0025E118D8|nr:nucleoside phosphorylase [Anaeromicrobium sp.]MCT4594831.1 nucleoside phosphorylase [Anaeromicrobium sp.]
MKQPHIQCTKEDISKMVILPGDPARVDRVAKYLDEYTEIAYNREFKTIKGKYKGMDVTVTSTGIGGASACIALEELVACGAQCFIRIGSLGAYQEHIKIGDLIVAEGAVREDGASRMYISENYPAVANSEVLEVLKKKAEELEYTYYTGLVRSHDSFYIDNEDDVVRYWNKRGILGADMETATVMTLGRLRNVKVGSILNNVVVYESDVRDGINDYVDNGKMAEEGERREIILALESLYELNKK